jgi:telomerase reverse transcriptase
MEMEESVTICTTVRAVVGPNAVVLSLLEFLKSYFPQAPVDTRFDLSHPLHVRLAQLVIVPSKSLKKVHTIDFGRRQSLASLIDDAVWVLVKQRERLRKTKQDGRNLLSQGYSIPNFFHGDAPSCPNMHPAVVMTQLNYNVLYWKSNAVCQLLHQLFGDEITRIILVQTSVFVPLAQADTPIDADNIEEHNYMQLCGPSCQPIVIEQGPKVQQQRKKRKRPMPGNRLESKQLLPQAHVPRKDIFYSSTFVPKVSLPSSHILNMPCEPEELLRSLLDIKPSKMSRRQKRRWKHLCGRGVPLCQYIIGRHRSCDYARLLNRYCPLSDVGRHVNITLAEAAVGFSAVDGVILFLSAVVRHVFPMELLGSSHNVERFLTHVESFVRLRRQEYLANKSILNGIKVTHASWLFACEKGNVHRTDHPTAELLLLRIMRWIFGQFIVPLVASSFHVTESEMSGKQVLYYRKPMWSIFRSLSMKKLLKQQYTEITAEEATQKLATQQMGFSRLRLLPKETGVRPIATLCKHEPLKIVDAQSTAPVLEDENSGDEDIETPFFIARKKRKVEPIVPVPVRRAKSTNKILDNLFSVLRHEYSRQEDLFGAGVDGLSYLYPRYREFVAEWRKKRDIGQPVYFVSVDIQHAYDSIDQKYLLAIAEKIITQEEYCVQRYDVLHPFPAVGRVIKRPRRVVGKVETVEPLHNGKQDDFRRCVVVDPVNMTIAKKENLLKQLREHLISHLVTIKGRYGDRYLIQSTGIPQGSILSTMLCNFYYGAIERRLLPDFTDSSNSTTASHDAKLLIRMVDDFLFATTNYSSAVNFLEVMTAGDPSLGASINKDKTKVSHPIEIEGKLLKPVKDGSFGYFPWCGMLFDLGSGAVRIDYDRLVDCDIGSGLTVERGGHEGQRFCSALKTFIRPRCIPILFDSFINDLQTQIINFYQMHVHCAAKAAAYLRSSDMVSTSNVNFLVETIDSAIKYGYTLINDRLRQADKNLSLGFSRNMSLWIGWSAFSGVFGCYRMLHVVAALLQEKLTSVHVNYTLVARQAIDAANDCPAMKELLSL